jgi:ketosteroid isomerase-like protein
MTLPLTAEDLIEIEQLICRYNFAFDRGDAEGWAACFTSDGRFYVAGEERARGHDSLAAFAISTKAPGQFRHVVTSVLAEGQGDVATNQCYCIVFSSSLGNGSQVFAQGVYSDQLAKHADGWRFTERRFDPDPV